MSELKTLWVDITHKKIYIFLKNNYKNVLNCVGISHQPHVGMFSNTYIPNHTKVIALGLKDYNFMAGGIMYMDDVLKSLPIFIHILYIH